MYTFKIKLFQTQRTTQFLPKSFWKLLRDAKVDFGVLKTTKGFVFARKRLKLMSEFTASNGDFNGSSLFAFFFEIKGYLPKKVSIDFSYTLTYLTLKSERSRIFHPCRVMFDFYRQAVIGSHCFGSL